MKIRHDMAEKKLVPGGWGGNVVGVGVVVGGCVVLSKFKDRFKPINRGVTLLMGKQMSISHQNEDGISKNLPCMLKLASGVDY